MIAVVQAEKFAVNRRVSDTAWSEAGERQRHPSIHASPPAPCDGAEDARRA
jgi:hypothetical protein